MVQAAHGKYQPAPVASGFQHHRLIVFIAVVQRRMLRVAIDARGSSPERREQQDSSDCAVCVQRNRGMAGALMADRDASVQRERRGFRLYGARSRRGVEGNNAQPPACLPAICPTIASGMNS